MFLGDFVGHFGGDFMGDVAALSMETWLVILCDTFCSSLCG